MSSTMTVKDVAALYLKNLAARVAEDDFDGDAFYNIQRELTFFVAKYGHQTIAECKQHDLTAWIADHPTWKAVDTKRRIVSNITACFNWALDEELIDRSPYRRPRSLRGKTAAVRRPATHDEYVQLMRNGTRPLRRMLFMMRRIGIRTCELRKLTWDEVYDLDGPNPHLSIARHKTFRRTGKPRKIGLDPSTARFLRNLARQFERAYNCDCEACTCVVFPNVFTNCKGTPWTRHVLARQFRRTAKAIGLDEGVGKRVSAYCLRHMYASDAVIAGVSTRAIADQLGHGRTGMIDAVYASSTRHHVGHLNSVAAEINRKRNKQPMKGQE